MVLHLLPLAVRSHDVRPYSLPRARAGCRVGLGWLAGWAWLRASCQLQLPATLRGCGRPVPARSLYSVRACMIPACDHDFLTSGTTTQRLARLLARCAARAGRHMACGASPRRQWTAQRSTPLRPPLTRPSPLSFHPTLPHCLHHEPHPCAHPHACLAPAPFGRSAAPAVGADMPGADDGGVGGAPRMSLLSSSTMPAMEPMAAGLGDHHHQEGGGGGGGAHDSWQQQQQRAPVSQLSASAAYSSTSGLQIPESLAQGLLSTGTVELLDLARALLPPPPPPTLQPALQLQLPPAPPPPLRSRSGSRAVGLGMRSGPGTPSASSAMLRSLLKQQARSRRLHVCTCVCV